MALVLELNRKQTAGGPLATKSSTRKALCKRGCLRCTKAHWFHHTAEVHLLGFLEAAGGRNCRMAFAKYHPARTVCYEALEESQTLGPSCKQGSNFRSLFCPFMLL
eukprot:1149432-Pelagomonas_calceolata.AAC.3